MAFYKRFLIVFLAVMMVLVGVPRSVFGNPGITLSNPEELPADEAAHFILKGMNPLAAAGEYWYNTPPMHHVNYNFDLAFGETETITSLRITFSEPEAYCAYTPPTPILSGMGVCQIRIYQGATLLASQTSGDGSFFQDRVLNASPAVLTALNKWHGGHVVCSWGALEGMFHNANFTGRCYYYDSFYNSIVVESPPGIILPTVKDFEWDSLTTDLGTTDFSGGVIDSYGIAGLSVTASADGILPVAWSNWDCAPIDFRGLYYPKSDPMPGLSHYATQTYWDGPENFYASTATAVMLGKRGWWLLSFKNVALELTTMVWLKLYDPSLPGDDPDTYDPTPEPGEESFWDYLFGWFKDFWEKLLAFFADLFGPADQEHMNMLEEVGEDVQTRFPFSIVAWGAGVAGTLSVTGTSAPNLDFTIPAFFGVEETILHVPFDDWAPFWTTVRGIFTAGIWLGFAFLAIQFIRKLWL